MSQANYLHKVGKRRPSKAPTSLSRGLADLVWERVAPRTYIDPARLESTCDIFGLFSQGRVANWACGNCGIGHVATISPGRF